MSHKLSVYKYVRPIKQKTRNQGEEKRQAAKDEVNKLLTANFIKEAKYTT